MSIAYALAIADAIHDTVIRAASDPRNIAGTPDEITAGQVARKRAEEALTSTISTVQNTLELIKATAPKPPARTAKVPQPRTLKAHRAAQVAARNFVVPADPTAGLQAVVDGFKAENMKAGKQSIQDMAKTIGPIVTKFDSILTAPYLNQYSATLNTVPVVGVKNNQLLYLQTKNEVTGISEVWSTFSSLPAGATIKDSDVAHIFPYKGDFYFAIGKTVWKKTHLSERDPALRDAVDDWPALYSRQWTALGESLPAANLAGIVPFAVLSAKRTQIAFHLITLAVDGTLSWLTGDDLKSKSEWEVLKYKAASGGVATPPKFTKIAYWNNNVVGIDTASNTWNITVSFESSTYIIADKAKIEPVTEFTATDAGPVGLRADGYLWKRLISPSPDGDNKDPVFSWQRWVKADGVVNIGVASPGVIFDMTILTRSLKSRYLDVQTSVYPVVETIKAFCTTHEIFLDNIAKAAQDYADADTDEKRKLAVNSAKSFVAHAKTWGGIVSKSVNNCRQSVTAMTAQLHDVRLQLEAQLRSLETRLKMLQAMLKDHEAQLSKLQAAFWGSLAATFLGLALMIAGVATGQIYVFYGGGPLMVGGLVAVSIVGQQTTQLAAAVADTKSSIEVVNRAVKDMANIVNAFTDLDRLYGTLNQFWGRLSKNTSNVRAMNDDTAELIGSEILDDPSSIEASQEVTAEMKIACQTYLDTLSKQGIVHDNDIHKETTFAVRALPSFVPSPLKAAAAVAPRAGSSFGPIFKVAQDALIQGDHDSYHGVMKHATLLQLSANLETKFAMANPAIWFDLPTLRNTSNIWIGTSQNFSKSTGVLEKSATLGVTGEQVTVNANVLDSYLDEARTSLTQSLQSILSMGNTILTWSKEYPNIPAANADVQKVTSYQESAMDACKVAVNLAASANNSFTDFNHKATAYQQDLELHIAGNNDQITAANAKCAYDIQHISVPSTIGGSSPWASLGWIQSARMKITDTRDRVVGSLNAQVDALRALLSSGAQFGGHVLSWIEMVQAVSGNLGQIHNTLVGMYGQILEDPSLYEGFLHQEWSQLVQQARDVLLIVDNSNTPVALWAVPRNTAIVASLTAHPLPHALLAADPSPLSDSQRVVKALLPSTKLGDSIELQATQADTFFAELEILLNLPFMKDIVGYWSDDMSKRQTLYDVALSLRSEYTNMIGVQYNVVQGLQNLALLQDHRAGNVANGKLPLTNFVKSTLASIRTALRASIAVNDKFRDSAKDFAAVVRIINTNITNVEQQISDLNDTIEEVGKEGKDKIIGIIARAIATAFATAALLVSFGLLGPVGASIELGVQLTAGAGLIASHIATIVESLSLADIIKLIEALKASRDTLQESIDQFKKIQPLFANVVNGVGTLNTTIKAMRDVLTAVQTDIELGRGISFTLEDAEAVQIAWQKVRDSTQVWLDTVNKQGIALQWVGA